MRYRLHQVRIGHQDKRLGQQGVSGKNGNGFAKYFMIGRLAPPQVVIVQRGQVVVN